MVFKIFIDSDGVIRDFVGTCEKRYQRTFNWTNQTDVRDILGFSRKDWGKELDSLSWDKMTPTEEAFDLFQLLKKYFEFSQVFIVTSVPLSRSCLGKCADWYLTYLPEYVKSNKVIFCPDKSLLASRFSILLDDHEKTCRRFSRAGGWSILFPRPWNSLGKIYNPLGYIDYELKKILNKSLEETDGEIGVPTFSTPIEIEEAWGRRLVLE